VEARVCIQRERPGPSTATSTTTSVARGHQQHTAGGFRGTAECGTPSARVHNGTLSRLPKNLTRRYLPRCQPGISRGLRRPVRPRAGACWFTPSSQKHWRKAKVTRVVAQNIQDKLHERSRSAARPKPGLIETGTVVGVSRNSSKSIQPCEAAEAWRTNGCLLVRKHIHGATKHTGKSYSTHDQTPPETTLEPPDMEKTLWLLHRIQELTVDKKHITFFLPGTELYRPASPQQKEKSAHTLSWTATGSRARGNSEVSAHARPRRRLVVRLRLWLWRRGNGCYRGRELKRWLPRHLVEQRQGRLADRHAQGVLLLLHRQALGDENVEQRMDQVGCRGGGDGNRGGRTEHVWRAEHGAPRVSYQEHLPQLTAPYVTG